MDKTAKERMKRYRKKKRNETVTKVLRTVTGLAESVTLDVTPQDKYPALLYALTDPIKRKKLEKVYLSLKGRDLLRDVRYGIEGPTFDVVGQLLEATDAVK